MVNTDSAQEAVKSSFHLADKGDVVLLSPACASFDLFKNYEDRGSNLKKRFGICKKVLSKRNTYIKYYT